MKSTLAFLFAACSGLYGSTFSYNVAVNTSSLSTTAGTIDFEFDPGDFTSDLATATITNFVITGPGSLTGAPIYSNDASGTLASSLVIANTFNENDALQALTFGTGLSFRVTLSEALTGTALTGSVFNFGVFKSDGFTPLLTADPNGVLVSVNLDNAGGAAASTTAGVAAITPIPTATPEPGTLALISAAALALIARKRGKLRPS